MANEHYGMYIGDPGLGIIAAGPVASINCGMLGLAHRRVVVRWMPDEMYCTCLQELDADGNHKDFDKVTEKMHKDFPATRFGEMVLADRLAYPLYHS